MKTGRLTLKTFFKSIYKDLTYLKWYHLVLLFFFGSLMVIFSIVDFNSIIHPEWELEILTWKNDELFGREYWRKVLMSLSGAASFTGAMCVVLTTFGKLSSFFWGIINCILYGLFAFAYGYGGDAQLNIIFFLPMQFWGILTWKDYIEEENEDTVLSRSLKIWEWILYLILAFGFFVAFYYEIPKFVEAIGSEYLFYENSSARILDACTNSFSIIAQFLSLYRYWEQWIFWISIDVLQITMYAGIAGFGINFNILFMWCLFLTNALFGLYFWIKREKIAKKKIQYLKKLSTEEIIFKKNFQGKQHKKGLIIDSFNPFTNDHNSMINKAIDNCEEIYIIIYQEKASENPDAKLRKKWMEEIYNCDEIKEIEIGYLSSFELPSVSDFLKQNLDNSKEQFEILYSSEKYGRYFFNSYLEIIKAPILYEYTQLDNLKIEIKNGRIISEEKNYLDYFHPLIKNYYVPRIVFLGPESCGKTTLAKKLAEHYKTTWVKEVGHDYCEEKLAKQPKPEMAEKKKKEEEEEKNDEEEDKREEKKDEEVFYQWNDEDFIRISAEQSKLEESLACKANKILICDTDCFATNIWYERYMNKRLNILEDIHIHHYERAACFIYMLFSPKKVAFVQDGTRDGEKIREWMFELFKKRLEEQNKLFFIIEGDYDEREKEVKAKIQELFKI